MTTIIRRRKFNRYNRQRQQQRVRVNGWIRFSPVRLIDEKGENLGIVETSKALAMAREKGLDLIEIAPKARPPVCRIMSYGKFQYQKSKQEKKQKSKQKRTETKGVRISLKIGVHDLQVRAKQAERFLRQGHRVKIDIILRGREKAIPNLAKDKLRQFVDLIDCEVKIEQEPKKQPRGLTMIVSFDEHENKKSLKKENKNNQEKKDNISVS